MKKSKPVLLKRVRLSTAIMLLLIAALAAFGPYLAPYRAGHVVAARPMEVRPPAWYAGPPATTTLNAHATANAKTYIAVFPARISMNKISVHSVFMERGSTRAARSSMTAIAAPAAMARTIVVASQCLVSPKMGA